jgi:hypothetical protein
MNVRIRLVCPFLKSQISNLKSLFPKPNSAIQILKLIRPIFPTLHTFITGPERLLITLPRYSAVVNVGATPCGRPLCCNVAQRVNPDVSGPSAVINVAQASQLVSKIISRAALPHFYTLPFYF